MDAIPPRSAARRLASELKLPSWKGTVVVMHRRGADVLVVAAEERWLHRHSIPQSYCGYRVETEGCLLAVAQGNRATA